MDILPISNLARIVEQTRHNDHEQPQKRQPQRKREKFVSSPVYTLGGAVEEEQPPKIDVLV